jgi:hypothetical protein
MSYADEVDVHTFGRKQNTPIAVKRQAARHPDGGGLTLALQGRSPSLRHLRRTVGAVRRDAAQNA